MRVMYKLNSWSFFLVLVVSFIHDLTRSIFASHANQFYAVYDINAGSVWWLSGIDTLLAKP